MTRTSSTDYLDWSAGANLYAKPDPYDTNPSYGDDVIAASETARGSGVDSQYVFTGLGTGRYSVHLRAGGSPAATDTVIGFIDPYVDLSGLVGTGSYSITATVSDEDEKKVQGAVVYIEGTSRHETSNVNGVVRFTGLGNGDYALVTSPPTNYGTPDTTNVTVDGGNETAAITLPAKQVIPPSPVAGTCDVYVEAEWKGEKIAGAMVVASLVDTNSFTSGTLQSSRQIATSTDSNGAATLRLIQASQFTDGDGEYEITVTHQGIEILRATVTVPDVGSINLEDLVGDD